jgi:hypothetical protein
MAMTQINMDGDQFPYIKRFTLGSTNVAHEILVTGEARTCTVRFVGADGKLAFETTGDSIHADFFDLDADTPNEFSLGDGIASAKGVGSFYLASATSSTVCVCMVEG